MSVFELERVSFRYEDVTALHEVTLAIRRGTRVAILGANGSGKSTLLRLLDALAFPEGGVVRFEGAPLTEDAFSDDEFAFAFRRRVGMVFQNPDVQLFNPTVYDELAFGPLQMKWSEEEIRDRIERSLVQFGIAHLRDRSPHRLSGGEKKRISLASILILEPEVLLLDEPTAALDPRGQTVVVDLLHEWAGKDRTVVMTTHDLAVVEDVADVCVVMAEGKIAATGAPSDIVRDEPLLRRTGLLHAHRHAHADGVVHSHPHHHHDHSHGK